MTAKARERVNRPLAAVRTAADVPGMPLDPQTLAYFETTFGCDLSHVRVHTDASASAAAREVQATAFTIGRDIYFAPGAFEPHTARGRETLAHEIAHTLHDRRSVRGEQLDAIVGTTTPGDTRESIADASVDAIEKGRAPAAAPVESDRGIRVARLAAGLLQRRDAGDSAQVVVTIAETLVQALANDPDDRLGRVRRSLRNLDDRTQRAVFLRLEAMLTSDVWHHLLLDVLPKEIPAGTSDGSAPAMDAQSQTPDDAQTQAAATQPDAQRGASDEAQAAASELEQLPSDGAAATRDAGRDASSAKPDDARSADTTEHAVDGEASVDGGKKRDRSDPKGRRAGPQRAPARGPARSGRQVPRSGGGGRPPLPMGGDSAGPEAVDDSADASSAASAQSSPAASGGDAEAQSAPTDVANAEEAQASTDPGEAETSAPQATAPEFDSPEQRASQVSAPPQVSPSESVAEPSASSQATSETSDAAAEAQDAAVADEAVANETSDASPTDAAASTDAASSTDAKASTGDVSVNDSVTDAPADGASAGAVPAEAIGGLPSEVDDGSEAPSGGGGGGSAIAQTPEPDAPALDPTADPSANMAAVGDLPPAQMQAAMGGVSSSVDHSVGSERQDLVQNAPQATPPAAPSNAEKMPAEVAPDAAPVIQRVTQAGAPGDAAAPTADPALSGPLPATREPHVTSDANGHVTAADVQAVQQSVEDLPTTDPALNVDAGAAPAIELQGAADPDHAAQQRAAAHDAMHQQLEAGARDAARPMGESQIYPTMRPTLVRAEIAASSAPSGAVAAPAAVDPAVAIVAREKSADDLRAKAASGSRDLSDQHKVQQDGMVKQREDSQQQIDAETKAAADEQGGLRGEARAKVHQARGEWTQGQTTAIDTGDAAADKAVTDARTDVDTQRKDANAKAQGHIDTGNAQVTAAREEAETKARHKREEAEAESENAGFFDRVASAVSSFFSAIVDAIKDVFDYARNLVKKAIAAAQELASAVIDAARDAIVGAIKLAGDAICAIGDVALAAFPELRDKFHAAIRKTVDGAVAAVNAVADKLKAGVKALLDLLGKALTAILDAYESACLAAVNAVAGAVKSAIAAAKALVAALAVFAVLIRDIAANPGQWISNLGAGLMDGVKNHLWKALKAAIKEWFNSKVEAVVGVGKMIFDLLKRGGIAFKRIAAMVFTAVKAAIPRAIIEFLIQKVISMLIPAAAAVMAIVEGLQAAWATASKVIAAFERFVAFLKAVRSGTAGPPFANALAAAAVAVIDFTANFIISKIGKAAKGVGGKLKGIATKIMAWFKRGAKAVGRGLKRVGKLIVRGAKAVGRGIKRAASYVANSRVGRAIRNSKVGKLVGKTIDRGRAAYGRAKASVKQKYQDWRAKRNSPEAKQKRLDRAMAGISPGLVSMLKRGVGKTLLAVRLAWWRVRYGLTSLTFDGSAIVATVNPTGKWSAQEILIGAELLKVMANVESEFVKRLKGPGSERSGVIADASTEFAKARHGSVIHGTQELTPFEQMAVLESGNPGPRGGRKSMKVRYAENMLLQIRRANSTPTMTIPYGAGHDAYFKDAEFGRRGKLLKPERGIAVLVKSAAERLDVDERVVVQQLMRSQAEREREFAGRIRTKADATAAERIDRAAGHYAVLEPARRGGIFTAHAVDTAVQGSGSFGDGPIKSVLAGGPMAGRGASSNPELYSGQKKLDVIAAHQTTEGIVHDIMERLVAMVRERKVVATANGFDLKQLGQAVEAFMMAQINTVTPGDVDHAKRIGKQLVPLLEAMLQR